MRAPVALAAVILAATSLSACGGGSDDGGSSASGGSGDKDTYCKDLKKDATYFKSLGSGDGSQIQEAISRFHTLADESPDEIRSSWKVIDGAFTQLEQGLKSAGITVEQFGQIQSTGKVPAGVDAAKLQKVVSNLQGLSDKKFETAGDNIEKHAKSECKVDLNAS